MRALFELCLEEARDAGCSHACSISLTAAMAVCLQAAACPPDPTKKAAMSTSFYRYFAAPDAAMPECQNATTCVQTPACWRRLLGAQIRGVDTEHDAVQEALRCALLQQAATVMLARYMMAGQRRSGLHLVPHKLKHALVRQTETPILASESNCARFDDIAQEPAHGGCCAGVPLAGAARLSVLYPHEPHLGDHPASLQHGSAFLTLRQVLQHM
jgi:hypothetical protein